MIQAIIIYVLSFLFIATVTIVARNIYRDRDTTPKHLLQLHIAEVIILFALIFNVLYTGYYGWNMLPATADELVLDTVTSIVLFGGIIYYTYIINVISNLPRKSKGVNTPLA